MLYHWPTATETHRAVPVGRFLTYALCAIVGSREQGRRSSNESQLRRHSEGYKVRHRTRHTAWWMGHFLSNEDSCSTQANSVKILKRELHYLWLQDMETTKCLLIKIFIYLFLERGREREWEGEKHPCVVASHASPTADLAHNAGMCPEWELNQWPFGSQASQHSIHWTTSARAETTKCLSIDDWKKKMW